MEEARPVDLSEEQLSALLSVLTGETAPARLAGLGEVDLTKIAQLGIATFAAARYPQAQKIFEALARLEPSLYLPHQYLGMIAEHGGDLERAALAYSEACARIDPANEVLAPVLNDSLFLLAGVLLRLRQVREAAEVLGVLVDRAASLSDRMRRQVLAMMAKIEEVSA